MCIDIKVRLDEISIHVLRVEDDHPDESSSEQALYFNPRPPCGGRPQQAGEIIGIILISIHVLRVEDDQP